MYFSHICHFRPMTQPNALKTNFRPIPDPTQPNPTRGSTQPMDNSGLAKLLRKLGLYCVPFMTCLLANILGYHFHARWYTIACRLIRDYYWLVCTCSVFDWIQNIVVLVQFPFALCGCPFVHWFHFIFNYIFIFLFWCSRYWWKRLLVWSTWQSPTVLSYCHSNPTKYKSFFEFVGISQLTIMCT